MERSKQQRFLKGALVEAPPGEDGGPLKPIFFQFNPETIERIKSGTWTSAQSQMHKVKNASTAREFNRLKGKKLKVGFVPSPEKISLTLRLDSTEKACRALEGSNVDVTEGILPELAVLESLMKKVETAVTARGSRNSPTFVEPRKIPLVLFVWGDYRVIPVTILSMTITEQKFDYKLNPTRAELKVSLQVLEEEDAKLNERAFTSYEFTESEKERMKNSFLENQQNANQGMSVSTGYPVEL